ncbi:MAG: LL-diaminopimelate aminotransferase [Clostridiales bacterium]|nr:LL-diaminopimelate aminotransferase [Clostridiales bacterium]
MKAEAKRIQALPAYLFARIEQKVSEAKARGVDVISLGIGDPDLPTPDFVVGKMQEEVANAQNHQYPSSAGMLSFRQAVADFYQARFGVELCPKTEVCSLVGSKEGIANINYCYVDPGDVNLVPDPGYPVYSIGTMLAGGTAYSLPLLAKNGFLPDLEAVPAEIAAKAKILWLNYPNNPTGAIANPDFFARAVAFAKKYDLLICHDNAYSEMTYDGYQAPSFLQTAGAKDVGIEFNSLSKPFNMTGWRCGFAVGNASAISALARYKSNVDSGVFQAVQQAAALALQNPRQTTQYLKGVYQERRDILVGGLNALGWSLQPPKATFYVWAPVPKGFTSLSFAEFLFEQAGVVVTPGVGYGAHGEGYFRAALTIGQERMKEAIGRISATLGRVSF